MDGNAEKKDGRRWYAVDVYVNLAKCYRVQADSREDAEKKVEGMVDAILSRAGAPQSLVDAGFEECDVDELGCHGEGPTEEDIEYF